MVLLPCSRCYNCCLCGECQAVVMDWKLTSVTGIVYEGSSSSGDIDCTSSLSYDESLGFITSLEYGGANIVNVSDLDRETNDGSNVVASAVFRCGVNYGLARGEWHVDVTVSVETRVPLPGGGYGGPALQGTCVWSGIVTKCDSDGGFPKIKRSDLTLVTSSGNLGVGGCVNFTFTFRAVTP